MELLAIGGRIVDEYERLETLRKRLKDQERWDGLSNDELRDRRYEAERAIKDLLLAEPLEAATALVETPPPGVLMVVCTHVGLCSECVAQADASGLRWWTPAQVVGGTPWVEATPSTSAKQAQPSSAGHRGAGH